MALDDTDATTPRLKICLAASGGGHVRQLLDLERFWGAHDHFFVTEDTALGQSLKAEHRTYFVPHFAWGQAKLGAPFRMIGQAIRSAVQSARVMWRERPDLVISTGAGAVFPAVLFGRLFGAHTVVIESFARFEGPSLFGRLASPLAHDLVVQSPKLAAFYPRAKVFDPFRILEGERPAKRPLVFATVGATLPFDRLVRSVETLHQEGAIPETVLVQTGLGGAAPATLDVRETLPFAEVQQVLGEASIVICHGGTGSLITALRQGCAVIAMPRLSKLGEHYDDHQAEIVAAFAKRGLVIEANSVDDLRAALIEARNRTPVMATTDPAELVAFLADLARRAPVRARRPAA